MRKKRRDFFKDCPIEAALIYVGGKWKSTILYNLSERPYRSSELMRLLPKITQRTLTRQLRDLEADGLIERRVFAEVPPRVEYRLSPRGQSLMPVLQALFAWGSENAIDEQGHAIAPASLDAEESNEVS